MALLFILILKPTELFKILNLKVLKINDNKIIKAINSNKTNKIVKNLSKFKKSKNNKFKILIYLLNIKTIEKSIFLTFNTKKTFKYLK